MEEIFGKDSIERVQLVPDVPNKLRDMIEERKELLANYIKSLGLLKKKGKRPMHKVDLFHNSNADDSFRMDHWDFLDLKSTQSCFIERN
jgi:hypothetical protein